MKKAFRILDFGFLTLAVPADAVSIAEGRRLATIRGCNEGCHGKGVSGGEFWNEPWIARMIAPDLTRVAARLSDPELERVIRHGVRANGRTSWGMPSSMFYHLTDEDLGRIIAFIRSLPVGNGPETDIDFGPLGRIELLKNPLYAYAEEIAEGAHDGSAPNLAIVAAYSKPAFAKLMATGVPLGGQKLDLMAEVARRRFSQFREDEVDSLYNYLSTRARESAD